MSNYLEYLTKMSNHQLQFASKTDTTGANLGSLGMYTPRPRFSPLTRLCHRAVLAGNSYGSFWGKEGTHGFSFFFFFFFNYSLFYWEHKYQDMGYPLVWIMMWLLFWWVEEMFAERVVRKKKEAVLGFRYYNYNLSQCCSLTVCGRHGRSLLCPVWQLLATCDCWLGMWLI